MLRNDGDFVSYSSEDTSLDSLLAGGIIDLIYWNYLCNFIPFGIYLNLRTFVFLNIGNWFVLNFPIYIIAKDVLKLGNAIMILITKNVFHAN